MLVARTRVRRGRAISLQRFTSTSFNRSNGEKADGNASAEPRKADENHDEMSVPKKRMSMREIQALQAAKASQSIDPAKRAKISTGKAFRASDGFLDFEEVPPPWKGREGPYKPIYLLYDANWILRKSKKADRIVGGVSVGLVAGAWAAYIWAPHLLM